MRDILILCHCPSDNVVALRDAVLQGARTGCGAEHRVRALSPFEAHATDVRDAAGLLLGTTENFGYMSGALKDFFERIYYPCLDATQGLPFGLFVKAGQDGTGARDSVERIVTGLRWRAVIEPLIMTGDMDAAWPDACREFGMTLAAGLDAGVF